MSEMRLPVVPVRDVVGYPHQIFPVLVGRPRSLAAVQDAMVSSRHILLLAQKDPELDNVKPANLYRVGAVVKILQILRLPEGSMKVLVEGEQRARVKRFFHGRDYLEAVAEIIDEEQNPPTPRIEALARKTLDLFAVFVRMQESIPEEIVPAIEGSLETPGRFADIVAAHLPLKIHLKQKLLETESVADRLAQILAHLSREIEILKLEDDIDKKVRDKITDSQREFYLREQLETIRQELGQKWTSPELENLKKKIAGKNISEQIKSKIDEELEKLDRMHPTSPEAAVIRNYVDWLADVPWGKFSPDNKDISLARDILEEDHYGLKKVKDRIVEHIAVMALSEKVRGPLLCLVGPPGVGKTSLGKSVARALGRNFVRISLGGIRDEAEIRGHRRTYIGALPGRIIQQMKRAESMNPVFLLDEIDKIGADFRGDPAAALLEALDPEQNSHFVDHYLEVDFDLSKVLFITTANNTLDIPPALVDRMEILRLPGYLLPEKIAIARGFLIPKQKDQSGLDEIEIKIDDPTLETLIREWTQEAGVRELERSISKIFRVVATEIIEKGKRPKEIKIRKNSLEKYLGVAPYRESQMPKTLLRGESLGLAWTSSGGEVLRFETAITKGKDELILTGRLGEIMRESARAALTFVLTRAETIGFKNKKFPSGTIHIHAPEGAMPKEGPSAGIAIASALASLFSGKPLPSRIAMTGEISLSGHVLQIGGLAEKLLAAKRYGIPTVIIPKSNLPDLSEIPEEAKSGLDIRPVSHMDEVLEIVGIIKSD